MPVKPKTKGGKGKKKHGKKSKKAAVVEVPVSRFAAARENPRLRWLLFNGGAAAIGHTGVWLMSGDPWAGAALLGRASNSLVPLGVTAVVAVAGYAGWKAGGLLGAFGRFARPIGAFGAAFWGQGTGPLLADVFAALHPWPQFLAPLLFAAGAGGLCWWALDRRCAAMRAGSRFVARIPLATVVVSSALYAPGAVL